LFIYKDITKAELIVSRDKKPEYRFQPDLESGDNYIKQAYEYLKTLPEFINAEDC
jgi:hypothetical protein